MENAQQGGGAENTSTVKYTPKKRRDSGVLESEYATVSPS